VLSVLTFDTKFIVQCCVVVKTNLHVLLLAKLSVYTSIGRRAFSYAAPQM